MKSLLPLCAAVLLAACSTPYHPAQIVEPDARFPGLIDVLAAQPERQRDVLLVHGICPHDASWAARTVAQLGAALQAATPGAQASPPAPLPDGQIAIIPANLSTPDGSLHCKSLIWSPLTQPLKRALCYDQPNKSSICRGTPTRAHLNALLKDGLLDDCLADAVIYGGVARDAIQLRMRDALLAATADQSSSAPLFVIAESLGSNILCDTLLRMMWTRRPAARRRDRHGRSPCACAIWIWAPIRYCCSAWPIKTCQPRRPRHRHAAACSALYCAANHCARRGAGTAAADRLQRS